MLPSLMARQYVKPLTPNRPKSLNYWFSADAMSLTGPIVLPADFHELWRTMSVVYATNIHFFLLQLFNAIYIFFSDAALIQLRNIYAFVCITSARYFLLCNRLAMVVGYGR